MREYKFVLLAEGILEWKVLELIFEPLI